MALMLVIKMIKVKLMFLLPLIIGKATAKKLLLKVLLFLIPGLAHLFKLCHYYHAEHAKYHHHHHKIKHHHHHIKIPVPVPVPIHVDHHNHLDGGLPYGPPSGGGYDYPPYPPHSPHHTSASGSDYKDYDSTGGGGGGSGYGNDYGSVTHFGDNEAHLSSWGLGSNIHEAGVLDAKNQPIYYKNHPYAGGYYPHDAAGSHSQRYTTKLQLLTPRPPDGSTVSVASSPPVLPTYDPFYSPILQKIDKIFNRLGFNDEPCRERLICSMYKTPHRFSPHSNLLSHELSRDAKDLQKPVASNHAVLRFYKYVQAARDGQDKKDCLRLYSRCPINTE
ncbi:conserved hypothetical protein [Pediculus humanus corporis]|uniref:Uncharacterized protein n=1 Tax=Pediculus humanus subsp. corporis TaxID=121224 RepID=E0VX98_PEDHC|nr:uncharacterized protein Phum_PHUM497610 [Pediculus humanus corporis]EEB18004.1 conserved hypothetical protein [Pediculus humanus corporis]